MGRPDLARVSAAIKVASAGHRAPSADNIQPWQFRCSEEGVETHYDAKRVSGLTFAGLEAGTLLAVGGALENMISSLKELELPHHADIGALTSPNAPYYRLRFAGERPSQGQLPQRLSARHTNRFRYQARTVPDAILASVAGLREGSAKLTVLDSDAAIARTAKLIEHATAIRFQIREIHEWLGASLRFTPTAVARGDGLDVRTVELPPGGRLLLRLIADWHRMKWLNRIGAHKVLARIDSTAVAHAPALILITSEDAPHSVLSAGRLLVRAWTELNSHSVAAQPYYVLSDILERNLCNRIPPALIEDSKVLAEHANETLGVSSQSRPRMLLRVGYPETDPVRSNRIPLERVVLTT